MEKIKAIINEIKNTIKTPAFWYGAVFGGVLIGFITWNDTLLK